MTRRKWTYAIAALALAAAAVPVDAASKRWDGGAGGTGTTWETAANWNADGVPTSADDILLNNDFVATLPNMTTSGLTMTVKTITYNSANTVTVGNIGSGGSATSAITLNGDGTNLIVMGSSASGTFTIQPRTSGNRDLALTLGGSGNIDVQNATGILAITTDIAETGGARSITKIGSGTLTLGRTNTYTGGTNVNGGTLNLTGSLSATGTLAIGTAGTLTGNGDANGATTITGNGIINLSSGGTVAALTATGGFWNGVGNAAATSVSSGTFTLNGTLGGGGNLSIASGATLAGSGTTSKNTSVTGTGIVNFSSGGAISGSLTATGGFWNGVGNAGTTTVSSGTFTVNGTMGGSGALSVSSGAKLAGTGTISKTVNINTGATLSPGGDGSNSTVGALATNAHTWATNSTYLWEIKDASGPAGTGYDTLNVTGALTVAATSASKMTIKLVSHGAIANWNNLNNYLWDIASATSFTSFDVNDFILDTTDFADDNTPASGYSFTIDNVAGKIRVNYVPEPASATLIAVGGIALLRRSRRKH